VSFQFVLHFSSATSVNAAHPHQSHPLVVPLCPALFQLLEELGCGALSCAVLEVEDYIDRISTVVGKEEAEGRGCIHSSTQFSFGPL
jgi:hypothetical protein